jgi:hypothetical protein
MVDTSKWSDKMRNAMMAHFGYFDNPDTTNSEDQAIHASIVEKIKPILKNQTPLIINDLDPKTHETTGNKPAKPETPKSQNEIYLQTPTNPTIPKKHYPQKTSIINTITSHTLNIHWKMKCH